MSETLEKYDIKFSYDDEDMGAVGLTSNVAMLARFIGSLNTSRKAGWLYHPINSFLNFGKTREIKIPEIGKEKLLVTKQQATLFEDEADLLTENIFTLPVTELQEILLTWLQFLAKCKTRKVEVTQGAGIINIINDGFINAMVIDKPVAAHWPDCGGSVGEYYSVSRHSYNRQKELTANLNKALISGSDSKVFEEITTFLNLFTNNTYHVAITDIDIEFSEIGSDISITYAETIPDDDMFTYWHYPNGLDLYLFTRSKNTIDQARVAEYVEMISMGARPKVLVHHVFYNDDSNDSPYYILDGHHKLLAYQQLRINAPVVSIGRTEDTQPSSKNILPQLLDILKTCEILHVLEEDHNITDLTVYMQPAMTQYMDKLLKEKKWLDHNIITVLYNASHAADENITEWAKERFTVLSTNDHQGKGQRLLYKLNNQNENYNKWGTIFIENLQDFYAWKKALLEDKNIPVEMIEKQQRLIEQYYPRPKPPEPTPFPRYVPYESPPRTYPEFNVFGTIARLLLAAIALLSITKGCR